MVEVETFHVNLHNKLNAAFAPMDEKPLKGSSLDVRNDPKTQFLQ